MYFLWLFYTGCKGGDQCKQSFFIIRYKGGLCNSCNASCLKFIHEWITDIFKMITWLMQSGSNWSCLSWQVHKTFLFKKNYCLCHESQMFYSLIWYHQYNQRLAQWQNSEHLFLWGSTFLAINLKFFYT